MIMIQRESLIEKVWRMGALNSYSKIIEVKKEEEHV